MGSGGQFLIRFIYFGIWPSVSLNSKIDPLDIDVAANFLNLSRVEEE